MLLQGQANRKDGSGTKSIDFQGHPQFLMQKILKNQSNLEVLFWASKSGTVPPKGGRLIDM